MGHSGAQGAPEQRCRKLGDRGSVHCSGGQGSSVLLPRPAGPKPDTFSAWAMGVCAHELVDMDGPAVWADSSGKSFCERETAAGTSISVEPEVLTEHRAAGVSAFCADTQVPSRGDVPRDKWP